MCRPAISLPERPPPPPPRRSQPAIQVTCIHLDDVAMFTLQRNAAPCRLTEVFPHSLLMYAPAGRLHQH